MSDKLPSIDNLPESELPSVDEFIKEEQELPSIDEFVEKEEEEIVEEEIVADAQDLTEILRLINNVRKDIPDIPEIKSYDEELERLTEQVEEVRNSIPEPPEIPEIKYYDDEIASLREEINQNAADIPEIKYYDEQVNDLEDKIKVIKEDIVNLPEPKYYETDLESLKEDILAVKESIPVFPKWVNEVNEVPDFSWIGKTFSVIDDDFIKVDDKLSSIRGRIDQEVKHIFEEIDVKEFESKNSLDELTTNFNTTKDKIYKELREAAVRIHETKHSFRNDDRLLKKDILSKFNVLKQRVEEEVKEFNRKNVETKDIFDGYFTALTEEIANLPEVKYYDEDVDKLKEEVKSTSFNISELYKIVDELKGQQEVLTENAKYGDTDPGRPITPDPSEKQGQDPLTPTGEKFATLKDLAANYRLFVNRVEQQLYTIGGGGAAYVRDLDDVNIAGITTGDLLIYGGGTSGTHWVGIASTALSGGTDSTLDDILGNGSETTKGMSVGVITATSGYFSGILTATNLNYDNVTDIYSTGIVTATKGIQITTLGLNIASGIATLTDGLRVGSAATIYSNGNAAFSGIVTANGGFVGDGSGLTGVANTDNVVSTTLSVSGVVTAIGGLYVGTAASIFANGNIAAAGIVTANGGFVGSGANITAISGSNIASGTVAAARVATLNQDTTGNAATATALETARAIGGVSFDGSAAINLPGVNTAGDQDTSGNAATATILETTRAIGGVNFNGSAAINLPGVNESGNQNTSGTSAGLTGSPTITVAKVNVGTAATIHPTGGITAGIVTATSFVGPLTGNVTGNASGSSGSCTGNAAGLTGTPNITVGDVVAASLDISGDADIDGTTNIDVLDVDGASNFGADVVFAGANYNITFDQSTDDLIFGDNAKAIFGGTPASPDGLEIYHDTSHSFIENTGTGTLFLKDAGSVYVRTADFRVQNAAGSESMIIGSADGAVSLHFNSSEQLTTTADGIKVGSGVTVQAHGGVSISGITTANGGIVVGSAATISTNGNATYSGIVTATSFVGDGSGLTGTGASEADTAVSSTSATSVLSFAHASYRSASIIIQVTQGSAYQTGRYLVIHDGTTASIIEESAIATGSMLATFTTAIVSSNLVVYVNMGSASSATVTVLATKVTV